MDFVIYREELEQLTESAESCLMVKLKDAFTRLYTISYLDIVGMHASPRFMAVTNEVLHHLDCYQHSAKRSQIWGFD